MRARIVENFQERMQLRRSLIELEDQNVQNSIEISKRQLLLIHYSDNTLGQSQASMQSTEFATSVLANAEPEVKEAWQECEQVRVWLYMCVRDACCLCMCVFMCGYMCVYVTCSLIF